MVTSGIELAHRPLKRLINCKLKLNLMKNLKGIISITSIYIVGALFFISCAQDVRDARDGRNGFDGFNGRDGLANIQSNTYFVGTGDVIVTGLVQAYFFLDANLNTRRWIALPYFDFGYS